MYHVFVHYIYFIFFALLRLQRSWGITVEYAQRSPFEFPAFRMQIIVAYNMAKLKLFIVQ